MKSAKRGGYDPSDVAEWARQRKLLPAQRYALGPTRLVFPAPQYFYEVMPSFMPGLDYGRQRPNHDYRDYRWISRVGLLNSILNEKHTRVMIVDTADTRKMLTEILGLYTRNERVRAIKTLSIRLVFRTAWETLVQQLCELRNRMMQPDWREVPDKHGWIDLSKWIRPGRLVDDGLLPVDHLTTALMMSASWIDTWMSEQHESRGVWQVIDGKPRRFRYCMTTSVAIRYTGATRTAMLYSRMLDRKTCAIRYLHGEVIKRKPIKTNESK